MGLFSGAFFHNLAGVFTALGVLFTALAAF
jgi:hypothetical protein